MGFEVAKYDTSRPLYIDPLLYSTYLGGSDYDYGTGIVVDSVGNAYVVGTTASTNFPTMNPLQPANGGGWDAFLTKINSAGSALIYSTYLGGSENDWGYGIAVDSAGNAYVTGTTTSSNSPVTLGAFQTTCGGGNCWFDGNTFVTELNPSGSALVYSSYLGGSGGTRAPASAWTARATLTSWASPPQPILRLWIPCRRPTAAATTPSWPRSTPQARR